MCVRLGDLPTVKKVLEMTFGWNFYRKKNLYNIIKNRIFFFNKKF